MASQPMTGVYCRARESRSSKISVNFFNQGNPTMKNSAWILNCVVVAFILAMSGCKESFTVVTSLFTDGSCDRTITVSSDTMGIPTVAFPLPIDSTWEMSWKAPVEKGEKYLFTAKKHFAHIDSMRQAYARINDSTKIRIDVSVEKDFRWFYTYFTYKEKYGSFNPFRSIPLSDFMTGAEVQRYLAGERSDSLKKKRDAWEMHNMFEVYYQGLLDGARNLHHPSLPPSLIESKKEELYARVDVVGDERRGRRDGCGARDPGGAKVEQGAQRVRERHHA